MKPNQNRALTVLPNSTYHIVLVELIEEVIEEMVGEKLARRACLGFRRIEKALYFLNPLDLPQIPLSSAKIAANLSVTDRTVRRDLDAINALFEATGGLRLHHWESGGLRLERLEETQDDGEPKIIEEVIPNTFYWPSPGGKLIDAVNDGINQFVRVGLTKARKHAEEKKLTRQLIQQAITDPVMQEALRERRVSRTVKAAIRADRKEDREATNAQGKLLAFPGATVDPVGRTRMYVQEIEQVEIAPDQIDLMIGQLEGLLAELKRRAKKGM
jgi:hypothetical protein